jgi:hypothetical protein
MSLFNTENTVNFSGTSRNFMDFFVDQKGYAVANSGSQTIASGAGVLVSVLGIAGSVLSGGAAVTNASLSGASILVVDGVSGVIPQLQSGTSNFAGNTAGILYYFSFGIQSGTSLASSESPISGTKGVVGLPLGPSTVYGLNAVFKSGLVAVCSGGPAGSYAVSLLYSKGV